LSSSSHACCAIPHTDQAFHHAVKNRLCLQHLRAYLIGMSRWIRTALKALAAVLLVLAAGAVLAGSIFLQDEPFVARMPPPQPEDVHAARSFVIAVRQATNDDGPAERTMQVPVADLNAIMRLGVRFVPQLRTESTVEDNLVHVAASLPLPWFSGAKWLNVRAAVPPFEGQFHLASISVGSHDLPPDLALSLGTTAANLLFGGHIGSKVRDSARSMKIAGGALVFDLRLSDADRGNVLTGVFGALRGNSMPPEEEIQGYYRLIRTALDDGTLPVTGSFLPHL
jgi:hypothetical protein